MTNRRISLKTLALGSCAVSALMAGPAAAEQFSVQPQDLRPALQQFATQGDQQVLFSSAAVAGKRTAGFSGEASPETALQALLAGTDLVWAKTAEGALLVKTRQEAAADPQSGSAAGDGADQGTVQALIVTAQKREEDIQDVPIAISAFTQEDLTRSQVAGGPDLMTQVPNMTFTKTNFSSYSIQLRGIGTQAISATTDPAVAVAFNNTPFIRNRFFEQEFYDLQRVEVLRGPQGTLYGRNATAGVVNIISQKPKFAFESKLSADVSNYSSSRLEGMINLPLVDDKVALRLAGAWTKRDGYAMNQITGNPIDGRDLWSTRLSLRLAPADGLEANLIWEHFQEDDDRLRSGKQLCHRDARTELGGLTYSYGGYGGGTPGGLVNQGCLPASLYSPDSFEAPNGFSLPYYHPLGALWVPVVPNFDPYVSTTQARDLRVIESTVDPHYSAETDVVELQFSYDLSSDLTLTSETGYMSDDLFSTQDYNRFNTAPGAFRPPSFDREGVIDENGFFCDPQIGCANRLVAVDLSTAKSRHFSQEFRLGSDYEGPFNFSLGANFLRYDTEDKYYVFVNTLTLYSTISLQQQGIVLDPYVNGVSDNTECLGFGLREPDPGQVQSVTGCQYIDPNPIGSLNDMGHNYFLSKNPYKLISYAVFGEAYYNITDNLKLTGGLRWTVDKKEAPRIPSWILAGETVGYPVADVSEQEWREPTGRLTIDWKPDLGFTDETLFYASYAHGYKAGGANPPAAGIVSYANADSGEALIAQSATHPKTFEAEFVDAFEIGAKNTMLDSRLTLNTNAFYYDYEGYQISYIVNRSAVNLNFDTEVWGLEVEADWRLLENLKLGFKGGYENTRVADGMRAVDVMDRANGGLPDENGVVWIVTRPFPTFPSNCIIPLYTVDRGGGQLGFGPNANVNGNVGYCEEAYVLGNDPVTGLPYVPNPTVARDGRNMQFYHPGYIGFDPTTAPNHGEGFYKDLSGNELPNAPHYTATITADYTLPLPSDWLMTLHTDLYYQSEAWTRIFNMEGYDKLKAYTNVNLAAIFTNEDAGWKVMAYVKNVFDRDSITGAFLNSDDSGLTTNVFLTEPRLYGIRVTKEWNGGPWWTGANPNHPLGEPYPLTVEIGGQVQRHDAPYEPVAPDFQAAFSPAISPIGVQNRDLDWGDGREVKLSYRPASGSWKLSAGIRLGRANSETARSHKEEQAGDPVCPVSGYFAQLLCEPGGAYYNPDFLANATNWSDASARNREEHTIVDFAVGKDVGVGVVGEGRSSLGLGLRYAQFESTTNATMDGIPDWYLPEGWLKYDATHNHYRASLMAIRQFDGGGPTLSWEAAKRLFGNPEAGHVDIDWSATGGVLFGRQKTAITGFEEASYFSGKYTTAPSDRPPLTRTTVDVAPRNKSVTVPLLDLSVGLSYEIQRIQIGAGYRWERYFDVLDVGYAEHKDADRTIDGPYFKIAVGFGG